MANTEIVFYIIVIVVIVLKLLFWIIYLLIRRRRLRQYRQEAVETCYEEIPAVPQPAYMYSGFSPEDLRHAALIESLPGYQADDPYKVDQPPPAYATNSGESNPSNNIETRDNTPSVADQIEANINLSDTAMLIEVDNDELICVNQRTM